MIASDTGSGTTILEYAADTVTPAREFVVSGVNAPVSLGLAPDGTVFIGDINASTVYQFEDDDNTVADETYVGDAGFGYSITAIDGQVLIAQPSSTSAGLFDTATGDPLQDLTVPGATGAFSLTTDVLSDGFAISDLAADNGGQIHIFKDVSSDPTAEVDAETGTLTITGTGDGETIGVKIVNGSVQVTVVSGTVTTLSASFPASSITGGIVINGGDGADTITSDSSNTIATEIHGGDGDDTITGGGGDDILFGEGDNDTLVARQGNDVAVGGDGSDAMSGGNGRDVLIGGDGSDVIEGDNGDDILVAGETPHDTDVVALAGIRTIWVADTTYTARVDAVRDGALDHATLADDEDADELIGGTGQDWFLVVGGNDTITGKTLKSEETTLVVQ